MFFSSGQRARHRFVDASIEDAQRIFEDPFFKQSLESRVTTPDALHALGSAAFVPNVRHGEVTIPRRYHHKESTPVVALMPGEEVRLSRDFATLTPTQVEHARRTVEQWSPQELSVDEVLYILQKGSADRMGNVPYSLAARDSARETKITLGRILQSGTELPAEILIGTPIPQDTTIRFDSRPLIALRYGDPEPAAPKSILPHEYMHVMQKVDRHVALQEASYVDDRRPQDELEAYHVGYWAVMTAMQVDVAALVPHDGQALFIESGRRLYADPNEPFKLNARLADYFQTNSIDLT